MTEQNIPAEDRYGKDVKLEGVRTGRMTCTPKPLAQYLAKYLDHEHEDADSAYPFIDSYPDGSVNFDMSYLLIVLRQALNAYESTENVKIKIEKR